MPESGRKSPVIIDSVVVLPAPLGPTTPNIEPRRTVRSMSSTATVEPYVLRREVTSTTTGGGSGLARGLRGARGAFAVEGAAFFAPGATPAGFLAPGAVTSGLPVRRVAGFAGFTGLRDELEP